MEMWLKQHLDIVQNCKIAFTIADGVGIDDGDKLDTTDLVSFRTKIGNNNLKYGAVYYPNLNTSLNYGINEKTLGFTHKAVKASDPNTPYPTPPSSFPLTGTLKSLKGTDPQRI